MDFIHPPTTSEEFFQRISLFAHWTYLLLMVKIYHVSTLMSRTFCENFLPVRFNFVTVQSTIQGLQNKKVRKKIMKHFDEFCAKLDEMKCHYQSKTNEKGKNIILLVLNGNHYSGLNFYIVFDDKSAQIKCYNVCKFSEEKNLVILQTVNKLNCDYRWTTFAALPEGTVMVSMDIDMIEETSASILLRSLFNIIEIVDLVYPILMKALYV